MRSPVAATAAATSAAACRACSAILLAACLRAGARYSGSAAASRLDCCNRWMRDCVRPNRMSRPSLRASRRSACCAGNQCGACCLYTTIGGAIYAGGALFAGVGAYAAMPLVGLLTSALHYNVRSAFKRQHGIAETGCCPDLAYLICCDACVLCQELRELDMRAAPRAVVLPTMAVAPPMVAMNPMLTTVEPVMGSEAPKSA